jgi:hypothetical protein
VRHRIRRVELEEMALDEILDVVEYEMREAEQRGR